MNANKIKQALAVVHFWEKATGRVKAVEQYLRIGEPLTHGEVDVLLYALNVSRTEITIQWSLQR